MTSATPNACRRSTLRRCRTSGSSAAAWQRGSAGRRAGTTGKRWPVSPRAASSVVAVFGSPPLAEMLWSAPAFEGANTMMLRDPHVPPRPSLASHRGSTVPPAAGTFLSLSVVKKAIWRLSGDQNGRWPVSVPGMGRASSEARSRTHSLNAPLGSSVVNTRLRPSGEMAESAASNDSVTPSGPSTDTRAGGDGATERRAGTTNRNTARRQRRAGERRAASRPGHDLRGDGRWRVGGVGRPSRSVRAARRPSNSAASSDPFRGSGGAAAESTAAAIAGTRFQSGSSFMTDAMISEAWSATFDTVDVRDVGMIERGQNLGFALEPREPLGIVREQIGQHLQRDVAAELRIPRAKHLAHPACADRADDFVQSKFGARG